MKKILFRLKFLLVFVTICTSTNAADFKGRTVDLTDLGAIGNDMLSDSEAFQKAFTLIAQGQYDELFIPKGVYNHSEDQFKLLIQSDVKITGSGSTTIICDKPFVYILSKSFSFNLSTPVSRGDKCMVLDVIDQLEIGDIIAIRSDTPVESAWNYTEADNHRISSKMDTKICFETALNFPYDSQNETVIVSGYQRHKVVIKDLSFEFKVDSVSELMGIRIDGCSVEMRNVRMVERTASLRNSFVGLFDCNDVSIKKFNVFGAKYGMLINNTRDVSAFKTISNQAYHPYAIATWSDGVFICNVRGSDSRIDAHPSFNVHYKNVHMQTGNVYFNCRALGVTLEDCLFYTDSALTTTSLYIGVLGLREEYTYLYKEYDVKLKNVRWLHNDYDYNGLQVSSVRNFIVDRCRTHAISTGDYCENIVISNSEIGRFKCYDNNYTIRKTVFNGDLLENERNKYAISCNFSGNALVDKCKFKNYTKPGYYLINYVDNPISKIRFEDCSIDGFSGLVAKTPLEGERYQFIEFVNCIIRIKDVQNSAIPFTSMELTNTKVIEID